MPVVKTDGNAPSWVQDRAIDGVGNLVGKKDLSKNTFFDWAPMPLTPVGRKIQTSGVNVVAHVPEGLVVLTGRAAKGLIYRPLEDTVRDFTPLPAATRRTRQPGESWSHFYNRNGSVVNGSE